MISFLFLTYSQNAVCELVSEAGNAMPKNGLGNTTK
jgi:hypothetical protein